MNTSRTAVVTGAASGIGRATALALAREGAQLVVSDIDAEGLDGTVEQGKATGATFRALAGDTSDERIVQRLVAECVQELGGLEAFHANAGEPAGWALIPEPTAKEERFCARQGIEIIEADVEDFLAAVDEQALESA